MWRRGKAELWAACETRAWVPTEIVYLSNIFQLWWSSLLSCVLSELPFLCFYLNATQGGYTSLRGLSYMYIRYFIISFVEAVGRKDTVGGASRDKGPAS